MKQPFAVGMGTKVGADFHLMIGTATTMVQVNESAIQINTDTQPDGTIFPRQIQLALKLII